MKFKPYLLLSTLVAALGGLLFGFDTAVISGTTEALKDVFQLENRGTACPARSGWASRWPAR